MKRILLLAFASASVITLTLQPTRATPITLATYGVGYIEPTVIPPSGLDSTFLNDMIDVFNGTAVSPIAGENYYVDKGSSTPGSLNPANPLNAEITPSAGDGKGQATATLHLGAGGFSYLVAQWDGPNGADAVYYVAGLTGDITIVNDLPGTDSKGQPLANFGLSGYWTGTSNNGGGGSVPTPDGASTVALLGGALAGIGAVGRRFRKA